MRPYPLRRWPPIGASVAFGERTLVSLALFSQTFGEMEAWEAGGGTGRFQEAFTEEVTRTGQEEMRRGQCDRGSNSGSY